jgi:glycosyltransferase involved in cell wall biosynthesis
LSSEIEGFPNAILEAMAARLPVITTPAGDAAEIVQHGISGYVVPHENPDALAEKMVLLASSPEIRQRFGAAGRDCVQRTYSYHSLAAQLISIYKQAAALQRHTTALAALKPDNLTI